jgi:peptidoglycan/LPS O-acetylase OafA/YrhL
MFANPMQPAGARERSGSGHLVFLDGVRGFACFYVMFHHGMLDLPASGSSIYAAFNGFFSQGHYAVDVFIVLSGYCLMLPLLKLVGGLALRILPTYYVAMACSLLLIKTLIGTKTGANWDASLPATGRDVWLHLLLIHEWSGTSMLHINSPFWSIGVEWQIYFLVPALFALRNRYGATAVAVASLVLGYAAWGMIRQLGVLNPSPYGSSPHYVGLFALGMWSADQAVRQHSARAWRLARGSFVVLSLTLAVLTWQNLNDATRVLSVQLMSGVVGLWAAVGLALLRAGWLAPLERVFSWRPAVLFGKLGFTIYLIHAPIAQLVCHYVIAPAPWSPNLRALLMPPIYLLATLAVGIPFFYLFERPFHALSRRQAVRPVLSEVARALEAPRPATPRA